ncbi:MAG TPA: HAMP domain-containing sensor histidine kinase, partial [Stellaceae bacterium]|nr:HAMP domain-containing sensor histidine kinase [Stellaceae bacterium]
MAHRADAKLQVLSNRLVEHYGSAGAETVRHDLEQLLSDGIDQDTEVYELIGPDGQIIAGNLAGWTPLPAEAGKFEDRGVIRNGQPSVSRLLPVVLADGAIIVVGRDLHDQFEIGRIVWRALGVGAMGALALAVLGAFMFRRKLEQRIAAIRRTAHAIEAGDMSRRVPNSGGEDEFALLGGDINRMLDRIEHLMEGVRHVSNAIAHDLRTPLARLRNMLDEAIRAARGTELPAAAARSAIAQIDNVIQIFDRLLQIAEAESGTRRGSFASVRLAAVIADVVELYDAEAEAREIALLTDVDESATAFGDRDLLASAIANLVDNALKYAGERTIVRVSAAREQGRLCVIVEDNGPGIPAQE